ncbi:MAG: cytochrome c biogenesis CcdA family protein [Candidatus Dormibacteria bacterium]
MTGLLALAFGAGLLAPVNPCGFGLLPAMLTTTLDPSTGEPEQRPVATRLAGGLRAGLALTLGFTATFAVIGLGLTAGIRSLITVVPWLAAAVGAVLMLVGLALLAGRHQPIKPSSPQPDPTHTRTGTWRIVVFGAGYAVASASCTLAVLLAVVAQAAATDLVGAVAVFTAYAAGSALLLITLALLAALAGHTLARALQRVARYAGRIAGALLAVSGAYLLLYWLPQLLGTRRLGDAGLAELAGRVATAITDHQLAVTFTAAVLVLIAVTTVIRTLRATTDAPRAGDRCLPEDATATAPPEHSTQ